MRLTSGRSSFPSFFKCSGINFQTFIVQKKRLRSTFPRYASRNHYLFRLSIGVMKKAIILNIFVIFKSIVTTVLRLKSKVKSFSYCYTHFSTEQIFLNLFAKAPALFVRVSRLLELYKVFIFSGGNCSLSAWTSSSIHRIVFLKYFLKSVDRNSIPTFCWMLLTNFISISSSFKKMNFNGSFFFVEKDHDFCKMAPTDGKMKITINKKLSSFQARQWIKSENKVSVVQN